MDELLRTTAERAIRYLRELPERSVAPEVDALIGLERFDEPLPDGPDDPERVIALLDEAGSPATMATAGPRFFGFVIGGSHPVAVAADWLATAWDQNAGAFTASPVAATLEQVAQRWLVELFGLPSTTVAGFVTGGDDGQPHGARRGAPRRAGAGRVGRRRAGTRRGAAGHRDRRRRGAPVAAQGPRPARTRAGARRPRAGGRPGPDARRRAAGDLRADDRLHAGRQREHRRVRPGRARSPPRRTKPGPGSTWTAPSACGRRWRRSARTSCAASAPPTRGRPTRTSGSTCPTTAGSPSCATPSRCAPRWA